MRSELKSFLFEILLNFKTIYMDPIISLLPVSLSYDPSEEGNVISSIIGELHLVEYFL